MVAVTVLITFHSKESGVLINAVKSVINQEYTDFEIIIIDDLSPISAESELRSLSDERINIYRNSCNLGMAESINYGLSLANGYAVAFLDFDDIWYSDKLRMQMVLFNQLNHDKAVIYSMAKVISRETFYYKPKRSIAHDELVGDYLFSSSGLIQTSGILLSTETARKVGMENFRRHTDYQFCLALEQYGCSFNFIDVPLYEHVVTPKLVDYKLSIKWLDSHKLLLSQQALISFKRRVILRLMLNHKDYSEAILYSLKERLGMANLLIMILSSFVRLILPVQFLSFITRIKNS